MPATNSLLFGWVSSLPRICIRFVLFQFQIARQMTGAANEAARATSVKLCDIILVYLTLIILQQCEQIVAHHSIKITCMHPGALLAARGGSPATPPGPASRPHILQSKLYAPAHVALISIA